MDEHQEVSLEALIPNPFAYSYDESPFLEHVSRNAIPNPHPAVNAILS